MTQATLSRDLPELKLVKTPEGYRPASALVEEISPVPPLARVLAEFLLDIRPAKNMLVLKTPPAEHNRLPPPWMPQNFRKSPEPSPAMTPC